VVHLELASFLGDSGSIAGVVCAVGVVGGVLLTQVRRARGKGQTRKAIDEVVVGVPAVVDARTGRVIQAERPGLIDRMDEMDTWRGGVDGKLDEILTRVRPNGGDTLNPGDTIVRVEGQIKQIADHIGLDFDG
jgi:hypothetical protein